MMYDLRILIALIALLAATLSVQPALAQNPELSLISDCVDGNTGDTICVSVIVEGFVDVQSIQIAYRFDPEVLRLVEGTNAVLGAGGFFSYPGPSEVRYLWTHPMVLTETLTDGTVLFDLCFEVIGLPGSSTLLSLSPSFFNEISNGSGEVFELFETPCTITIGEPNDLGAMFRTCGAPNGLGNGFFEITVFGGTGPYTYDWVDAMDPGNNGSGNIATSGDSATEAVPPGTYTVTVTDNDGNTAQYTVEVSLIELLYSIQGFDPTCFNFTNGRIVVEFIDGAPDYGVVWENTSNSEYSGSAFTMSSHNIPSLPSGFYDVTVFDANGCSADTTIELVADPFVIDAAIQDATCNGSMDGAVTIDVSGGNPFPMNEYEFEPSWIAGTFRTNPFVSPPTLNPGTHSVTITDMVNNCDTVFTFTVGSTNTITADVTITDPVCFGSADGEIQLTGRTNGNLGNLYTVTLYDSTGAIVAGPVGPTNPANFQGLTSGVYYAVLSDPPCSSDTIEIQLEDPEAITIRILDVTPTGCTVGSTNGEISVLAEGGTVAVGSDYTYTWNGGTLTGPTISNLSLGAYTLTVSDDNGCTADTTINVSLADPPMITDFIISNLSCSGDPTASVEVIFTPGDANITSILWSTGATTAVVNNLPPDTTINVTIRDANLCFDIEEVYIPASTGVVIDSVRLESPTCPGDQDGQITVFTSGGQDPITYIWSTGDTTNFNLLPGLGAGQYGVTVTSSDTCGNIDSTFVLSDPAALDLQFSGVDSSDCANTCTGTAVLTPDGGVIGLPYEFSWETGQNDDGFQSVGTNLCAGWTSVTVTQDNFCFYVDSVFIPSPASLEPDSINIDNVSCFGAADGSIELNISGGIPPVVVSWGALPDGPIQDNLGAGVYSYVIADANGCEENGTIQVFEPDSLSVVFDSSSVIPISCMNPFSGRLELITTGGTSNYNYTWLPDVSSGELATGLPIGLYAVTVTDANGCTDTASFDLPGAAAVVSDTPTVMQPACFGELGELTVSGATGGSGGYTFSINGGAQYPLDSMVMVPVGVFNVIVQDSMGCSDTTLVTVTAPPPIELSIDPEDPVVDLGDSLQLELIIENAQGFIDSIIWSPTGPLSCYDCGDPIVFNATPGAYMVTVVDSAGCVGELDIFVEVNDQRKVYIPNAFSPNSDGRNEEFAIFTGTGVTGVEICQVYDRWGELMASRKDMFPDPNGIPVWDGRFNGEDMPPGVYVYFAKVNFVDGETVVFKGDVTLVR